MQDQSKSSKLSIQSAIVILIFVGLVIYATHGKARPTPVRHNNQFSMFADKQGQGQDQSQPVDTSALLEAVAPVTAADHIRGSLGAKVTVIEYSDTECPFCKNFHLTMKTVMSDYNKNGVNEVAWVYRHFPIDSRHPKARKEAEALECAGELGGADKFWAYTDRIYDVTPSNNGLDAAELPNIAKFVGLDVFKFNTCLSSGKYAAHVASDLANAEATGGPGTPWSIIVNASGRKIPVNGAEDYSTMKQMISQALQ
ncbi:MAG: thioredoxin domain-containing protein [bacterium]